eukprot:750499-Hanusia_phi.AAC.8
MPPSTPVHSEPSQLAAIPPRTTSAGFVLVLPGWASRPCQRRMQPRLWRLPVLHLPFLSFILVSMLTKRFMVVYLICRLCSRQTVKTHVTRDRTSEPGMKPLGASRIQHNCKLFSLAKLFVVCVNSGAQFRSTVLFPKPVHFSRIIESSNRAADFGSSTPEEVQCHVKLFVRHNVGPTWRCITESLSNSVTMLYAIRLTYKRFKGCSSACKELFEAFVPHAYEIRPGGRDSRAQ